MTINNDKIKELYKEGVVPLGNIFDQDLLGRIFDIKNQLFKEFPFGQDDNLNKKIDNKFQRPGSYMIWDIIERNSIFKKILENKIIHETATKVLGKNFTVASFYIRRTPKVDDTLDTHIDYQGGLSFSILLDKIGKDEGETFFYKKSHKYPPPVFTNTKSPIFKKEIISTTGNLGDTFFWFPDCWHGRNINKKDADTTILMCHMGNVNHPSKDSTGRKVYYSQKIDAEENITPNKYLKKLFKFCGNSPNNIFAHFLYCLIYFKFNKITNIAIKQRLIFTRIKFGNKEVDNFSLFSYLKLLKFSNVVRISIKNLIKIIIGKKATALVRKAIN